MKRQNEKHGLTGSKFYRAYKTMLYRCYNENDTNYKRYGGRGITVCDRWKKFENFRDDMYGEFLNHLSVNGGRNTSLDRMDNDLGYSKSNCKWKISKEQANNRRDNKVLSFGGESKTVTQWAEAVGVKRITIYNRIRRGWPLHKVLDKPQ